MSTDLPYKLKQKAFRSFWTAWIKHFLVPLHLARCTSEGPRSSPVLDVFTVNESRRSLPISLHVVLIYCSFIALGSLSWWMQGFKPMMNGKCNSTIYCAHTVYENMYYDGPMEVKQLSHFEDTHRFTAVWPSDSDGYYLLALLGHHNACVPAWSAFYI